MAGPLLETKLQVPRRAERRSPAPGLTHTNLVCLSGSGTVSVVPTWDRCKPHGRIGQIVPGDLPDLGE